MMHVLLIVPSISRVGGGVSEVARLSALGLAHGSAVRVSVVTLRDTSFDDDIKAWGDISVTPCNVYGPKLFGFSPAMLFHLFRARPDIVHVHALWMFHCLAVLIWSLLSRRPYVVTPHGMLEPWIVKRSPVLKWLVSTLYQNTFLRRSACIQVLTDKEAQDLIAFSGDLPSRTIPNYAESPKPLQEPIPRWLTADLAGRVIYLYFGRIHEKKGCLELCEAWKQLCESDAKFCERSALVFCGWIDALPNFEEVVIDLNRRLGNIVFGGPQYGAEKSATLRSASFLVLPSKSEGLPMVVLEAWDRSKPVIMTRECNLPLGFEWGAAIEVSPQVPSLVDGLARSARLTSIEREEIGSRGRTLVEKRYSKAFVIGELIRLYTEILGGNSHHQAVTPLRGDA